MRQVLLCALFAVSVISASAQTIPNGDFEEWNLVSYGIPEYWNTSVIENLQDAGVVATTEVSGEVNSGIHLETMLISDQLITGYFSNTDGDPLAGEGGQPYAGIPTGISGYCRYNLPAQDTALLVVICKNEGMMTSFDLFKFKGTGVLDDFTFFSLPLSNTGVVDTVIIAATCSNLITNEGIEVGSWIEFDELAFTGESPVMPPIPGGSFDNWTDYSWDRPLGWNVRGIGISRVNDSYSGSYAVELANTVWENGSLQATSISTSEIEDGPPTGGLPYSNMQDTLCGYYRFLAPVGELASVSATIWANGENTGGTYYPLPPAEDYTYFEMPLNSFTIPDTLGVEISSAAWPWENALPDNRLIIDHLQLKSAPLGIFAHSRKGLTLFPNPVVNTLHLVIPSEMYNSTLNIYDQQGRNVYSTQVTQSTRQMDVSFLNPGLYMYQLGNGDDALRGQFIVIR